MLPMAILKPSEIAAMAQDSKRLEDAFAAAEKSYTEVKGSRGVKEHKRTHRPQYRFHYPLTAERTHRVSFRYFLRDIMRIILKARLP